MSIENLVNQWIDAAMAAGASDIHFEPDGEDRVRVRMRVDGKLKALETSNDAKKVIARAKVLAGLDVNERVQPLDGRFRYTGTGKLAMDVRVSSAPCLGGEKIVMRLIDNRRLYSTMEDLGLTKRMLATYRPLVDS